MSLKKNYENVVSWVSFSFVKNFQILDNKLRLKRCAQEADSVIVNQNYMLTPNKKKNV